MLDGGQNAAMAVIMGVVVGCIVKVKPKGLHIVQGPGIRHGPGAAVKGGRIPLMVCLLYTSLPSAFGTVGDTDSGI